MSDENENEVRTFLKPYSKINFEYDQDVNGRMDTMKLLRKL